MIDEIDVQIREDGADFYAMARRFSQDAHTRPGSGFFGRVRRTQLPKGIAARVFAASPGDLFGPEKVSGGFALYLLQQIYPATPDDRVKKEIRKRLFKWLQREMQQIYSIQFGQREIGLDALVKAEILPRAFGNGNREPFDSASII